ncbi:uncharacterized protein J8A68_000053 [[Candida] subhashii]|uniref:Kinase n=1 Tax=[Candida] subhashii TaxID=561895 RepID=A0A8J5UVC3_9ASCO|nr:uncharacterized protein J8A68_000053 [[Candida] subhashii]KAG7666422.1 hypothetical protein J8A68_000053 [[Candida] subhashii]
MYVPSKHQAAGHDGCLTLEDGSLFIKLTVQQEIDFYTQTQTRDNSNLTENDLPGSKLIDWMPVYMGTLTQGDITKDTSIHSDITIESTTTSQKQYIVLHNCYHGFKHPSILDIKLGSKLTDDQTTPIEKIARLQKVSESTTSGSLSFRICGMKIYNGDSDSKPHRELYSNMNDSSVSVNQENINENYLEFNKFYGRSLDLQNIKQGISLYFDHHLRKLPKGQFMIRKLISSFHKRLQLLYNCLLDYEIRIFSGSLLFIYENDLNKWAGALDGDDEMYEELDPLIHVPIIEDEDEDEDEDDENPQDNVNSPLSALKLIDFAHAKYVEGQGHDENILQGIENLIDIFQQLLNEQIDLKH